MVPPLSQKAGYVQDPIAVIGLACRLPGNCNSPTALWDFLERGGVAHNEAPKSRFNLETHHDGSRKPRTMRSPGGMFLENIDPQDFDAQFFGISHVDAVAMDPQQRQLLEVVYECLENAGITQEAIDGKPVGCFVASYAVDYADIHARDPEDRPPSATIGIGRAILSNRISHFLNIKGPSFTVDTACSGSLVAVDVACRYLNTREITSAIVAAGNMYLSPEHNLDDGAMKGAASLSGRCHTFDSKADGYIKAEAVNAVILKRLDDAIRDGDPIRAIIRGSATNSDGRTVGIASPSAEAQAAAIRDAYSHAGISDVNATSYVECHGTGTPAGDPIEVNGISSVFTSSRPLDHPLIIGSIKSNIGHSEPAAGLSGLLKAVLSIESGFIPRNPTFITPNPKIDFDALRVRVPKTTMAWPVVPFRRAGVNSFGYGGSNAHLILDEAKTSPQPPSRSHVSSFTSDYDELFADDETTQPFTLIFSANDENSLKAYCKVICKHLIDPNVAIKLPDLSYTLSERRSRLFHRAYFVADKTELDEGGFVFGKKSPDAPKIGFVFTGQGAQWPQMGKQIIETFPVAKSLVQHLDDVLQSLPNAPPWLLLDELVEPRSPERLRIPEFSQPLTTALQLAILAVLESWGVSPTGVVGHSSGEIAGACAAGLLTPEGAIKIAYFRGQACVRNQSEAALGMLAVGLGADRCLEYINDSKGLVQIGCFNSPNSVTLSGDRQALENIQSQLQEDGHFARMLQVNFAYHSKFMEGCSDFYKDLIQRNCGPGLQGIEGISMFSSVTGSRLDHTCDAEYWTTNMTSPVSFDKALREMVSGREGPDFLIEVGPSGALGGPIKQIIKALGDHGSHIQYYPALSRGKGAIKTLFNVAGRLFVSGGSINLTKVNELQDSNKVEPSVIIDLPNYVWNHSTKYWHESEASRDWRFRKFPHHDLLGTKILGTSWNSPSWRKTLQVDNLHWLKDHRMGQEIIFPAAAFIAMAVESLYQAHQAIDFLDWETFIDKYRYRLRNITFPKALVLQEKGAGQKIMITLWQKQDSWYEFKISSLMTEDAWSEHSRGFICLEDDPKQDAPKSAVAPLLHPIPGHLWYNALHKAGYNFGPLFQKHLEVESLIGTRESRSIVSLAEPEEEYQQSYYPMHPTCIDGCLQTVGPSLWNGDRCSVNAVLIPAIIESIIIKPTVAKPEFGISVASSAHVGVGRLENPKNYASSASIYDPDTKALLFQVSGLRYHKLDVLEGPFESQSCAEISWKPDITHLTKTNLLGLPLEGPSCNARHSDSPLGELNRLIDLIVHKKPNLKVLEVNVTPHDMISVWLDREAFDKASGAACVEYQLLLPDAVTLMNAQEKYDAQGDMAMTLLDFTRPSNDIALTTTDFDLIIIKLAPIQGGDEDPVVSKGEVTHSKAVDDCPPPAKKRNVNSQGPFHSRNQSSDSGYSSTALNTLSDTEPSSHTTSSTSSDEASSSIENDSEDVQPGQKRKRRANKFPGPNGVMEKEMQVALKNIIQNTRGHLRDGGYILLVKGEDYTHANGAPFANRIPLDPVLEANRFSSRINLQCENQSIHLAEAMSQDDEMTIDSPRLVALAHLTNGTSVTSTLKKALMQLGWEVEDHYPPFSNLQPKSTTLVLDELSSPLLTTVLDDQWQAIKDLTSKENKILWVTTGSQFDVKEPDNALIHGLSRTIRAENPFLSFVTLDTESSSGPEAVAAIDRVLKYVNEATPDTTVETEFVERRGVLHVSRIRPSEKINQVLNGDRYAAGLQTRDLHDAETCIRLRCERVGTLDSLCYAEVSDTELPLRDNLVEVEIAAAGVNFKDVAVTMGIVPEDEYRPGLEGAGVIRRVGNMVSSLKIGQRVLVYEKGTFANRIQVTPERVYPLPDSMSFEDAASMPSVYLVAIYGLFHHANVQKNQRVLIHSASGGVGIAAIQLCQYIGAQIFATVGTDEKRNFLTTTFGIPPDRIFSSRSTAFASQIMSATEGKGIDIVLNSLTGNLLDESWRCIADGGTMIEIGKKDILARNSLTMEPFNRNATYRGVDMSHKQISDPLIARLLSELMELVRKGHVKPISPITVFPFEDVISALRFLRAGTHIGKVVISNGTETNIKVPVWPAARNLALRSDASYLVVGGLKGLCGSLAVYLAQLGARHLVILCRSGYGDEKSQAVLQNIRVLGCQVQLCRGDVANPEDVQRAFKDAKPPIKGVIQGTMVLRDKIFTSMTVQEFHETISCKVKGTWNLHTASLSQPTPLDFFTLLSSVSGVIGQKGQANYAAANVFLDSFASYRRHLGLPATSIDLGAVEDIGYVAEHSSELHTAFDAEVWTPISESLLHQLLRVSILQQIGGVDAPGTAQLITGIATPHPPSSPLVKNDARFRGLLSSASSNRPKNAHGNDTNEQAKEIRALLLSLQSAPAESESSALLASAVSILAAQFTSSLRLSEPIEPAKPLTSYGLDSLAAVEFRNWVRLELGAELTTLDIMGASSLFALGEKVLGTIRAKVAAT